MKNALDIVQKYAPQVVRVRDAKQPMGVRIVKRDVRQQAIKDHQNCAVALACKRAFDADSAIVGTRTAYIVFGSQALRFRIPASTSEEIKAFDRGKGFTEGIYMLYPPMKGERLGGGHTGRTHNPSGRKGPKFKYLDRDVRTILG